MINGILFQVLQFYRLSKFDKATIVLDVILSAIDSEQFFYNRLADDLDAIYDGDWIGNLEILLTQKRLVDGKR